MTTWRPNGTISCHKTGAVLPFISRLSEQLAFSSLVRRMQAQVLTAPCSTRRVRAQVPPAAIAAAAAITLPCGD
jgi:hypothetical protein